MTDCKNCKYTDDYCASGDCNKIQANNLACNKISLTEQWKKGELPEGHYYVKDGENMIAEYLDGYFYNNGEPMTSFSGGVDEVLAEVPSYEEWKASYNCMLENEVLRLKNAQLKELLKECQSLFVLEKGFMIKCIRAETLTEMITKIDEVLK